MLNNSNIRFFEDRSRVIISYSLSDLKCDIAKELYNINTEKVDFKIDKSKLFITNKNNKQQIALLYNVDLKDQLTGWYVKKMCLVSEDLGFIITPLIKWYRHRVRELYHSIEGNIYKAHLNLSQLNDDIVLLVIDYNLLPR